jgi:hypothetical protein
MPSAWILAITLLCIYTSATNSTRSPGAGPHWRSALGRAGTGQRRLGCRKQFSLRGAPPDMARGQGTLGPRDLDWRLCPDIALQDCAENLLGSCVEGSSDGAFMQEVVLAGQP